MEDIYEAWLIEEIEDAKKNKRKHSHYEKLLCEMRTDQMREAFEQNQKSCQQVSQFLQGILTGLTIAFLIWLAVH